MKVKRLIFSALISSALVFSGCSSKAANSAASNNTKNSTTSSTSASAKQTENNSSTTENLKPIKPNTVPQLSTEQKKKIDSNMNSALKNLDNTLKSIQDPSDINLDSTN
ncbi:hypothetical protein [Clostridium omnivorum]|uniref:Lipoprotein n=1 Tax=Clostridium omnivorum TaxID=1604902 RepID=A0ABQ5N2I4_9CLOT|nr:hypothetical protein [Clostridium sp. E14]GLC29417.1 hypothetical protein bsdE14_08270 [Clostridium sp. E14]